MKDIVVSMIACWCHFLVLLWAPKLGVAFQPTRSSLRFSDMPPSVQVWHVTKTPQQPVMLPSTTRNMATDKEDIWAQQKALVAEFQGQETSTAKREALEKYEKRANALVGETAYVSLLIFPALWLLFDNPFFPFSYLLGASFGLAYTYGLGKYVSSIGGSVDDTEAIQGAGLGQARFAFLILLFVLVGKFRSAGLEPIPCIGGFFTYQLASLSQGLKEIDD